MNKFKIYPVTYKSEDKRRWLKEQLVLKYRNEKPVSTFLDLRGLYKSRRNYVRDLKQCKVIPQYNKIIDLPDNFQY